MLTSLFYKVGIKSENHTASILILKKLFDLDNKDIKYSKKERIDTQYYLDSHITEKQVFEAIESAEDFSKRLTDFVAKLTTQQIYEYRKSFKYLISGKPKNYKK